MKTFEELFKHQLMDLHNAEEQLVEALPTMAKKASDPKLQKAFEDHLEETKEQKNRLEDIFKELGISSGREKCKAMEGLIREAKDFMAEAGNDKVMDAGLIATAQRAEHYEISAYGTAVRYAKELGHHDIAQKLQYSLDEEYSADGKLTKLAEGRLNKRAMEEGT